MESGFPAFMNQGAAPKPSAATCSTGLTVPHMKVLLGAVKVSVAGAAKPLLAPVCPIFTCLLCTGGIITDSMMNINTVNM